MSRVEVAGIGEVMALFVPEDGPLGHATTLRMRLAGAESNTLIALARLGHRCAYVSAVGTDPFGDFAIRTLEDQGVDTRAVRRDPDHRTGIFFKDPTPDDRRRVQYYRDGSAASNLGWDALDVLDRLRPRVLVVSGLTLGLGDDGGLGSVAAAAIRRAGARGATVVFDANLRDGVWDGAAATRDFAALRPHLDVVLAGDDELTALVPDATAPTAAGRLLEGGCRAVVLKHGARGAAVVEATATTHVDAVDVDDVVDVVGAGDALAAGVVAGLLRGWPVPDGVRLGALLAARVIAGRGDWESLPAADEADALIATARGEAVP